MCMWLRMIRQVCFFFLGIVCVTLSNILYRPVYAGEVSGDIELGAQQGRTSTSDNNDVRTKNQTQRLNLDYSDYLYRPWLADYRLGGTLSESNTVRDSDESTTSLTSYRFNGKLFPYSPFPLTLYAIENDTDVTMQTSPDSSIDTKLYGADLKLDFYTLPTTNLFYYGQTTRSNLVSVLSEQDSSTGGINMFKRWEGLTANLRYENSDYSEKYTARSAQANRLTSSWVYRPSDTLQTSVVYSDYQRKSDNPDATFDPLYSDQDSRSHNVSMLWNPTKRVNIGVYGNYFLDDYEASRREARDGRVNIDYNLTDHLSAFASGYELHTDLNGEAYNSRDKRSGLAYTRAVLFGSLELQGRLSGGRFTRQIESANETQQQDGSFNQTGGRAELGLQMGSLMVSPYYDVNYGYNGQSNIHATKTVQQEKGLRLDGAVLGGRLNGNVSYTTLEQESDMTVNSEQFRSYLNYEHRVLQRATVKLQAGSSYTKGHVENATFTEFTQTENTEVHTSYNRIDYVTPVFGSNVLCSGSYLTENRTNQSGVEEHNKLFDVRFTHQFGKLFSEAGFMRKQSETGGIVTEDSIWFAKVRRDFSFGDK